MLPYFNLNDIGFDAVYEKCGYSLTIERFDRKESEPQTRFLFDSLLELSDELGSIINDSFPAEIKSMKIKPYFRKVR